MTGFVLDTNVWIALLKSNPEVVAGVRRVGIESLYLCAPVWSELWFGACNSQRVTENQGRKTPGNDRQTGSTPDEKWQANRT